MWSFGNVRFARLVVRSSQANARPHGRHDRCRDHLRRALICCTERDGDCHASRAIWRGRKSKHRWLAAVVAQLTRQYGAVKALTASLALLIVTAGVGCTTRSSSPRSQGIARHPAPTTEPSTTEPSSTASGHCVPLTAEICAPPSDYMLRVRNGSSDPVTISAWSDASPARVAPGADVLLPTAGHPPSPWILTVSDGTGRYLARRSIQSQRDLLPVKVSASSGEYLFVEILNSGSVQYCPGACAAA